MGIDVDSAMARANELRKYASELRSAQRGLAGYKEIFGTSWQGAEICYYASAVGNVELRLNQAALELESIANLIVTTAKQIKGEEEAAERARREAEERARREAEEAAEAAAAAAAAAHAQPV